MAVIAARVRPAAAAPLRCRIASERRSTLPSAESSEALAADTELGVEGITSFVTPNADFYRIDTALVVPQVSKDSWTLKIDGLVDNPMELTFDDLLARPQVERYITLSCVSNEVGGDLVGNARWQGVLLKDILDEAGLQPGAAQLASRSVDGWTCGTPVDVVMDGRDAMLAVAMNGEPLPARARLSGPHGRARSVRLRVGHEVGHRHAPHHAGRTSTGTGSRVAGRSSAPVKTMARIDTPRTGSPIARRGRHRWRRLGGAPRDRASGAFRSGSTTAGVARRRTRRRAVERHVGPVGVPLRRRTRARTVVEARAIDGDGEIAARGAGRVGAGRRPGLPPHQPRHRRPASTGALT